MVYDKPMARGKQPFGAARGSEFGEELGPVTVDPSASRKLFRE